MALFVWLDVVVDCRCVRYGVLTLALYIIAPSTQSSHSPNTRPSFTLPNQLPRAVLWYEILTGWLDQGEVHVIGLCNCFHSFAAHIAV